MKALFVLFVSIAGVASGSAQSFNLDWRTVDGGGGVSSGDGFTVRGTIGQPDAGGPMTAGPYSVTGGFWSFQSVTPSVPRLTIVPAGPGLVRVSWSPPTPGYILAQSESFDPATWSIAPSGTNNPAIIPVAATTEARFYMLGRQ